MSDIQRIQPADLPQPGGHCSHGTVANGFVFVSGQLPVTSAGPLHHGLLVEVEVEVEAVALAR